jgi:protein-ribulosamine 3-kinase
MHPELIHAIDAAIAQAGGRDFATREILGAAGGSIHRSFILEGAGQRFFIKTNTGASLPQFAAETAGLRLLAASRCIRVPEVVCTGVGSSTAFLVLECLALRPASREGQARLGHALATMHAAEPADDRFGLDHNNFVGTTPQVNARSGDWVEFFRERRLRFQLELAQASGYGKALAPGYELLDRLNGLFRGYAPRASLLHGDLWSGNAGELAGEEPVLFDPAVYVGDRESDLAMTELFGGFAPAFYAAYDETWARDAGYKVRRTLYQLYHVLNHLNLFGAGYLAQAQHMIATLNAELR